MSVKNKGRVDRGLHTVHEPSEQGRLAGSRLAGNDDKALPGLDTVTQSGESFPIVRINIRKPRIGSDTKGQLCQSKMFTVHTWGETYRVNSRVARTICPVLHGGFLHFDVIASGLEKKPLIAWRIFFRLFGQYPSALDERSAVRTVEFFIAIVCHPSASPPVAARIRNRSLAHALRNSGGDCSGWNGSVANY